MATAQTTLDLARRLAKAARSIKMYGGEHSQSVADIDGFKSALERMVSAEGKVTFLIQGNAILVQDLVQPYKDATVAMLVDAMRLRKISSITFLPGFPFEEVARLAVVLAAKPDAVCEGNELKPQVTASMERIRLNEIRFMAVSTGETVVEAGATVSSGPARTGGAAVDVGVAELTPPPFPPPAVGAELTPVPGKSSTQKLPAPVPPGAKTVVVSDRMQELLPLLEGLAQKKDPKDLKRKLADLLARDADASGGVSLGEQVRKVMERVPDGLREQLSTPSMKAELSGAILARQLQSGADVGSLQKEFQDYANDVGGAMALLDAVTRSLQSTGDTASVDALEKAMKFLPMVDKLEELLNGNVLVADSDPVRRESYRKALADRGYDVDVVDNARDAVEQGVVKGKYDCILLDMMLPDNPGQWVLSRLLRAKAGVPVVIASPRAETYMMEFEVLSYAKKKLVASQEVAAVVEAVKEIANPRMRAPDEQEKIEHQRARAIQNQLVLQELPALPGWEAAFTYKPAGVVGGDYVDIFPVDLDKFGFVVGDVSGKGFPGAMVMVMVRSAFRMATFGIASPRDALVRISRLIRQDMTQGMFVSVVYGILDLSSGSIRIANAGHNPPFLYDPASGQARRLSPGGLPIGIVAPEKFEHSIADQELQLQPGAHLFVYTDGVVEAMNEAQQEFGEDRTITTIQAHQAKSPGEVIEATLAAVAEFRGAAAPSDDVTILDLKMVSPPGEVIAPDSISSLEE